MRKYGLGALNYFSSIIKNGFDHLKPCEQFNLGTSCPGQENNTNQLKQHLGILFISHYFTMSIHKYNQQNVPDSKDQAGIMVSFASSGVAHVW